MAKRPSWTGFLKLSLVTCPVQLFNATTRSDSVSFHFIHPKTRNRIQMKPFDPDLGEVERKDLVRGYELLNGKYVTVTDDDLAQIRLKSTKAIDIEKFVDFDSIDPLYFDGAYFVMPEGPMAAEAYGVIREAMRGQNKAALARLVLSYREHWWRWSHTAMDWFFTGCTMPGRWKPSCPSTTSNPSRWIPRWWRSPRKSSRKS
jgi:DNA end-binding protein Ku